MIANSVKERVKTLRYDKEYTYALFDDLNNKEAVKKALKRMPDKIQFIGHGKFYKKNNKLSETITHNPQEHTFNYFWQSSQETVQETSSVIRNYLKSLNAQEIHLLCKKFGYCRVKAELIDYYKQLYKKGYVDIKGMNLPLTGRWDRDPLYRQTLRMLDDSKSY